jgi:TonB family protein
MTRETHYHPRGKDQGGPGYRAFATSPDSAARAKKLTWHRPVSLHMLAAWGSSTTWGMAMMKALCAALILLTLPAMAEEGPPVHSSGLPNSTCDYPEAALQAKAEGTALVAFVAMDDGTFRSVSVLTSSGNADLDKATLDCVSHWRFDPKSSIDKRWIAAQGAYIAWKISGWPGGKPVGLRIGIPHNCMRDYPVRAFHSHVTGTTTVRFRITDEGQVRDPQIVQSSGSADLDKAALYCANGWHYAPAVNKGNKVEAHGTAEIPWSIDNSMVVVEHFDK